MLSVRYVQEKLGLAAHILCQATAAVSLIKEIAHCPLMCGHGSTSHQSILHRFSALTIVTIKADESLLCKFPGTIPTNPMDFDPVEHNYQFHSIPLYVQHRVIHTIGGTCMWKHTAGLVIAMHHHLSLDGRDTPNNPNTGPHAVFQWADIFTPPKNVAWSIYYRPTLVPFGAESLHG